MILELPPDAKKLLAKPEHGLVTEMLLQFFNVSFEDTLGRLYFSDPPPQDHQKAVLEAEARILMGLRKNLADALRLARDEANPDARGKETSPAGAV